MVALSSFAVTLCALVACVHAQPSPASPDPRLDSRLVNLESQTGSDDRPLGQVIGMSTLLLASDEYSSRLPLSVLQGYGTTYDMYINEVPDLLVPHWHAIVVTDTWFPHIEEVRAYASEYGIRMVVLHSTPSDIDTSHLRVAADETKATHVAFDASPVTADIADVMNINGVWAVDELQAQSISALEGSEIITFMRYINDTPIAGASEPVAVIKVDSVPAEDELLVLTDANPARGSARRSAEAKGPVSTGKPAAFISKTVAGTEEMHFRFSANTAAIDEDLRPSYVMPTTFTHFNLALGNVWFNWVTRGLYLGQRRISLGIHIDDWFINTQLLDTEEIFRISGEDVEIAVQWKEQLKSILPAGSMVTLEPAFNGGGIKMFGIDESDNLINASKQHVDEFNWVSHTWTHQNLDWLEAVECNNLEKECNPDADRYTAELSYNIRVAEGLEVDNYGSLVPVWEGNEMTPAGIMPMNTTFSRNSLVTPEISGLWPASYDSTPPAGRKAYNKNELLHKAFKANEIYAVTGDNSRPELSAKNPYHGMITTAKQYGVADLLIMPRYSPNIAFSCNSKACLTHYYDDYGACSFVTYGPSCPGKNMTGDAILEREAKTATVPLLQYRHDPYMFHQANVKANEFRGGQAPLVGQWMQLAIEDLLQYVNKMPIVSRKMDDLADLYRKRMSQDNADMKAYIQFDTLGNLMSVDILSENDFDVTLTINQASTAVAIVDEADVTEVHGLDMNLYKKIFGNSVNRFKMTGVW
ncbi:hypothetical protein SARC_09927 [Sphaeroforma arctica JP610]|uniref:Agd3 deacetylase domain-containing protein n=1 Tax=Sphaeroforma arctica JP610 TaxID=667725 RepID=A0A0L0FLF7_9EUKA|nr:hypothetical protein SARC_09927 [Sphaeroforma arctica JP610]KNC77612.1 hypothetical protein SARC_09927 [Sphaeroforma arctica JP610]|eukprot:XP_014151514.1 hypothetical protein SARC_09927 [Sphaeroforma arctica JP610]